MQSVQELLNKMEAEMAALDLEYQVYKASCFEETPMSYIEWKASKAKEEVDD